MSIFDTTRLSVKEILERLPPEQAAEFLLEGTKVTPLVWEANKRNGVRLILSPDKWLGYSNQDGRIELGTKEVPEHMKRAAGLGAKVEDKIVKRYLFSHENNHHVLFYIFRHEQEFPEFISLFQLIKDLRRQGIALSQFGSLNFYNSGTRQTAHEEDLVELLNKYCINPTEFQKYLDFLVNADLELLKQKNLPRINQVLSDRIFKVISETVAKFLQMNGVIPGIKK